MTNAIIRVIFILCASVFSFYSFYYAAEKMTAVVLPGESEDTILYSNQSRNDLTNTYLEAIGRAEKSILLLIYNLSEPSITHALRAKADTGVDVTVICDGKASRRAKKYLGANVKVYPRNDKGLMHLKILVVDKQLVILGSANLSRHSLRIHGNLIMGLDNSQLADFVSHRAKEVAIGEVSRDNTNATFTVGSQKVELWFLPANKDAVDRIINLIDQAKKSIKIAMFTWTRRDFAHAVIRSALRGVKVEAVIDHNSTKSSSKKIARLLYREKVPLLVNTDAGLLHHKFLLIDETTLVNGSANWTKAAFTQNNDCFVVLHNLTEEQKSVLKSMWQTIVSDSTPYRPRP